MADALAIERNKVLMMLAERISPFAACIEDIDLPRIEELAFLMLQFVQMPSNMNQTVNIHDNAIRSRTIR